MVAGGGVAGVVKDEQRGRRALSAARARADRGAGAHIFSSARRLETRWAAPFPTRETAATRQRADRIGSPLGLLEGITVRHGSIVPGRRSARGRDRRRHS